MAVFRIFLSNAFYGFSGFAKEITPCSRPETVIRRDHVSPFLLKEWMTSVVFLADVYISVVTTKDYFSNITRLDHRVSIARCLFVAAGNNIALTRSAQVE